VILECDDNILKSILNHSLVHAGQNILIPLMWFEELIDPPPENVLDMLAEALSTGSIVSNKALVFSVVFLIAQIVIFGSYTLWKSKSGITYNSNNKVAIYPCNMVINECMIGLNHMQHEVEL